MESVQGQFVSHGRPYFPEFFFVALSREHPGMNDAFNAAPFWFVIDRHAQECGGVPALAGKYGRPGTATTSLGVSYEFRHPSVKEGNALDTHVRDHIPLLMIAYRLMLLTHVSFPPGEGN